MMGRVEDRVLHKGVWVVTLLGTLLLVQDYKKVKFPVDEITRSVALKRLKT